MMRPMDIVKPRNRYNRFENDLAFSLLPCYVEKGKRSGVHFRKIMVGISSRDFENLARSSAVRFVRCNRITLKSQKRRKVHLNIFHPVTQIDSN